MQDTRLEEVYQDWCHKVSKADFAIIAAEAVLSKQSERFDPYDPFGEHTLIYRFLSRWKYGRLDH